MLKVTGRRYLTDAARAFERAPVEVVVAVLLAAGLSTAFELAGDAMMTWTELAVAGILVFTAAWTGTMLHALGTWTARRRWTVTLAGAVAALLYALLVVDFERQAEVWRALLLVGAAVLWLIAMPQFGGPRATALERTRAINGRVLLRTLGAALYCLALFAGLAIALAAVNNLFELNMRSEIYGHVWGWIFVGLAPWIVIGGLPDYVQPVGEPSPVARVAQRIIAFLVPPLLALYYVILYAYAVRIGITGEVPQNLLSPLVLAAGLLAAVALVLFEPRTEAGGGLRWLRLAPPLFLPLAALGVAAIFMRFSEYGWTEFRLTRVVVLIALALLAAAATMALVRRQRFALHFVPLTLAGVLVAAAVGPWSVTAISRRSQQAELRRVLSDVGVNPDAAVAAGSASRSIDATAYERINSTSLYLARHFGPDALPPAMAAYAADRGSIYDLASRVGLARGLPLRGDQLVINGHFAAGTAVRLNGSTAHRVTMTPGCGVTRNGAVTAAHDSASLRFTVNGQTLTADLGGYLTLARPRDDRMNTLTGAQSSVDLLDADGRRRGMLLVLDLNMSVDSGIIRLRRVDGLVIVEDSIR